MGDLQGVSSALDGLVTLEERSDVKPIDIAVRAVAPLTGPIPAEPGFESRPGWAQLAMRVTLASSISGAP